ncbi:hypothetical protein IG631_23923 [Alternaria alternata]|nr:hypothetical protein IG631_23923 [Alternaria alternata]
MSCYTVNIRAQSVKAAGSMETAMMSRVLYITIALAPSFQLDVAEKGTLGAVGAEKFRVALVLLSQ